mmetsp:Transcript_17298/g.19353  ORF Transcript_17298/g.19353 Transcript_17298/m.19353 type:complete len:316 (-) Transcript_17298:34-981(-)
MFTQTGTPYYASPEVWKDKPYDSKSDLWSLGCVLYEVCALKPPFTAANMKGLYNKVIKGDYTRIPTMYSDDLSKVIDMCLQVIPSKRPTAAELLRKKEIVLHLRESGYEEEKKSSASLLDTIKLPPGFNMLKVKLPTNKYDSDLETTNTEKPPKLRNYSARGRESEYSQKLLDRERSLSALKRFEQKPTSSNSHLNISRVHKQKYYGQRPPKSNRAALYNKNYDRPSLQLPPIPHGSRISNAAGIPTLADRYRAKGSRERSESSRVLPLYNHYSSKSIDYDPGYKRRRAEVLSRHKIQQQLVNKAFGLPIVKRGY